jgi:hypothetical protein
MRIAALDARLTADRPNLAKHAGADASYRDLEEYLKRHNPI